MESISTQKSSLGFIESAPSEARERRGSRFFDRAIFISLLLLIALTAIPYGTVHPWWEAIFEALALALGALHAIKALIKREPVIRDGRLFLPVLALIALVLIQALFPVGFDPYGTWLVWLKLLSYTVVFGLLLRYTDSLGRLRTLIYMVFVVSLASALFGILRQATQNSPGFILPFLMPDVGFAQFINRNHFAYLMEMSLGLTLGIIASKLLNRNSVIIYLSVSLPLWTALVLANSRAGIISLLAILIVSVFILLFHRPPRHHQEQCGLSSAASMLLQSVTARLLLIAFAVLVMTVAVVWMGGERVAQRLETIQDDIRAQPADGMQWGRRQQIWRGTWQVIKSHPVLGIGPGSFNPAITQYDPGNGRLQPYAAHNDYLEILLSFGIVGTAIILFFIALLAVRARRSLRSPSLYRRAACLGALTGISGVAVHSFFDFGLQITFNALIFIALIVIAIADFPAEEKARPVRSARLS